jgi:hypothetical protein
MTGGIYAQAPTHLAVGRTEELITLVLFAVGAIAGTWLVLHHTRGRELAYRTLVLAGSAVCIVFEPVIDRTGGIWYADKGHNISLPEMWGIHVGVHMVLAYYVFLGVVTLLVVDQLKQGLDARRIRNLYGAILVLAAVLEMPVLFLTHVYTYYGSNQPFYSSSWLPEPLWYPFVNATLPFAMAAVVMTPMALGRRWHMWLLPVLMPMGLFAMYLAPSWPVLTALNSTGSLAAAYVGAVATVAISLLSVHLLGIGLPRLAQAAADPESEAPTEPRTTSEPVGQLVVH